MPLTRKSTRSKTRKNVNKGRFIGPVQQKRKRTSAKQARFSASVSQYAINKKISKAMSRMSETKLLACNNVNAGATNGTPTSVISGASSAEVYAWRGVLQSVPASWDAGLVNLGGIVSSEGTGEMNHIGQYIYLKKTHLNFQIDALMSTTNKPLMQFRVIVAKSRQSVQPAGTTDYPQNTLFINQTGTEQGHASTSTLAMNTFEVMNNPLNKRNWVILRDMRFYLATPVNIPDVSGTTGVGYNQKYPSRKNFRINLPHYCKTRLSTAGSPVDYDAHYVVYIYATAVGATTNAYLPDNFRVFMRGTTSFTDN